MSTAALASAFAVMTGCAHASLDDARAAYTAGDLRRSASILAAIEPSSDADKRGVDELVKQVTVDRKRVVDNLLADAGRARGRADEGSQGYSEAIACYEAALSLLEPKETQAKSIDDMLGKARAAQRAREQSFKNARKAFESQTKCGGAQERDRLAELWSLRRASDGTTPLASITLEASQRCAKAERYDDALRLRAVLDEASRREHAHGVVVLDEWPAEAHAWFALLEIRAGERSLRVSSTQTPSIAAFGATSTPTREETRRPSSRKSTAAPQSTVAPRLEPPPAPPRGDSLVTRARRLYDDGSIYDALVLVDMALSEDVSDGERAKLEAQFALWSNDRRRLVDDYLKRGENALREEQIETAYAWYQRILTLDPSHEVAQDRVRKLDRLKALKEAK